MESLAFLGLSAIQAETLSVLLIIAACSAAFQSTKWAMINSGRKLEELPAPYNRGFNTTGLWRVSRHPNYFAEQSIWVSFYLFSIVAGSGILNWSVCGAVLLILLFMGSSTLGEHISKSKYPEYGEYIRKVNRYFPGKPYCPRG